MTENLLQVGSIQATEDQNTDDDMTENLIEVGSIQATEEQNTVKENQAPYYQDNQQTACWCPPQKASDSVSNGSRHCSERNFLDKEIRIVLLGKSGTGKSATGNTIIGEHVFKSVSSATSETRKCSKGSVTWNNRNVIIVDTPGMFDTEQTNEQIEEEIQKCVGMTSPGLHAIILVFSLAWRYTEEEATSVEKFVDQFGENIYKYSFVLFTRGDDLEAENITFSDHIKRSPAKLQSFIDKCGGRTVCFNNRNRGEERQAQVNKLLNGIWENVSKNEGQCYTNEMYEETEKTN